MTSNFIVEIKQILTNARQKAYLAINSAMVDAYWNVGKRIVEEEQNGKKRATYGKQILKELSKALTNDFGRGFSERSLREFRQFYLLFPEFEKWRTAFAKLSWSHFQRILKVNNDDARMYYLLEASTNNWSVRTLDRNISTLYYQRIIASQIAEPVKQEMIDKTRAFQNENLEFVKNPYILEFLGIESHQSYTENNLELSLLNNLQKFLLELGKGFAFVSRQQLIRTETSDFFIDLVFYNFILKCFVIIDLKTSKITHQDIGQLDMYVRMYDDFQKKESDNPTIGILLCTETDSTVAKYSVLNGNSQLFASKYMPYLPTEDELIAEIEHQRLMIKLKTENNIS